jgi:hypothetical protein
MGWSRIGHQGAAEFSRKLFRDYAVGKTPEQVILVFVPVAGNSHMNAALFVKRTHCIELLSEAARWYGNFHDKQQVADDGLAARAAFVPSTHLTAPALFSVQLQILMPAESNMPHEKRGMSAPGR